MLLLLKKHRALFVSLSAATVYFLFVPVSGYFYHDFQPYNYIVLHSVIEAISIVISLMCFGITLHSHKMAKNSQNLFLGMALLSIGTIDIFHTLSYMGMPDFITANSVNKATQLWIIARLIGAGAFLAAAFIRPDMDSPYIRPYPMLAAGLFLPAAVLAWLLYYPETFPAMFVPGTGLTPLKIDLEYVVVAAEALTAALVFRMYIKTRQDHLLYFVGALMLGIFSEMFFTLYASPYDIYNLMGHVYKMAGYLLIYMMLFVTSIEHPYQELSNTKDVLRDYTYHLEDMVMERTNAVNEKNRELYGLNRLKNDLLAMCSHDMKTPLQVNMLLIELMQEGVDGPLTDKQRENLDIIGRNDQELRDLIANLLDLARTEQGGLRLNAEVEDVGELVGSWASKHQIVADMKRVGFVVDAANRGKPMHVNLDAFKIRQVLNNLISNAFKFTPEGGEIRLTATQDGHDGWLTVRMFNTGPAIPASSFASIFEKYAQAGGHQRAKHEGVGLGLNIAKNLVELHGGRIWAESEEGAGTAISFTIPPGQRPEDSGGSGSSGPL